MVIGDGNAEKGASVTIATGEAAHHDDQALMTLRAATLFTCDARGRMLLNNEPSERARQPAPRCYIGCSARGYLLRVGATVPDDLAQELAALVRAEPPTADLRVSPALDAGVRTLLARHAPVGEVEGGPAYRFPERFAVPGSAVRVTSANRDLLRDTLAWLYDEVDEWQPCFGVVADGVVVSLCLSSRVSAGAAEAGVGTLPDYRGRGYAVAATAAWAAAVRSEGRIPFYSTTWENLASRAVARRLGCILIGADASWE
ncbi:MAG: GNAT family N-acetyltransferase [Chloroflexi bacterium]|nr:MAG: GNAT family N-acetyltransferase [Chloroflexota bacterium]